MWVLCVGFCQPSIFQILQTGVIRRKRLRAKNKSSRRRAKNKCQEEVQQALPCEESDIYASQGKIVFRSNLCNIHCFVAAYCIVSQCIVFVMWVVLSDLGDLFYRAMSSSLVGKWMDGQ